MKELARDAAEAELEATLPARYVTPGRWYLDSLVAIGVMRSVCCGRRTGRWLVTRSFSRFGGWNSFAKAPR